MARIDVLPSIDIIRGLKGILDFYMWKGLPCVRAWPKYRPARQTAASLAAALTFGAIVKSYSLLGDGALEAYREDALDQPRTARDIMVTGVFGNLHEASMSDFLDLLVECRDFLSDLTALLNALDSISADEIDVNVERSILPTGAATTTAQATQLTALQKIDDLQDALQSKGLDRLIVRGEDQLFSYKSRWHESRFEPNAAAGENTLTFTTVPAGQIWKLTLVTAFNSNTDPSVVWFQIHNNGSWYRFHRVKSPGIDNLVPWNGEIWLDPGDRLKVMFAGCTLNDNLWAIALGHKMTLET